MRFIDAHAHIGTATGFLPGGECTADILIAEWDASGIECGMISIPDRGDVTAANDRVRPACDRHPGRIFGYVYRYPPDVRGSLRELDRCHDVDCFRGVKLHPCLDAYYPWSEEWYPVYERIEALALPTLWHRGTFPFSSPLQIALVARRFSGPHILGHFGIAELSWECAPAVEWAPNIIVDTSIKPVIKLVNAFIDQHGAERVLWGSDYPCYEVEYERLNVQFLGRSDDDRRKVGAENAARLFGL